MQTTNSKIEIESEIEELEEVIAPTPSIPIPPPPFLLTQKKTATKRHNELLRLFLARPHPYSYRTVDNKNKALCGVRR